MVVWCLFSTGKHVPNSGKLPGASPEKSGVAMWEFGDAPPLKLTVRPENRRKRRFLLEPCLIPVGFRDVNIWRCWSLMISTFQCWNQNEVQKWKYHIWKHNQSFYPVFYQHILGVAPWTELIPYHTIPSIPTLKRTLKLFSWNFSMNTKKNIFERSCLFPNHFFCRSFFLTFIGYLSNFTWRYLWFLVSYSRGQKIPWPKISPRLSADVGSQPRLGRWRRREGLELNSVEYTMF